MSSFSQSHNTQRLFLATLLLGGLLSLVSALSTPASSGSPARSVAALASTRSARLPASTLYPNYLPLILKAPPTAMGSPGGAGGTKTPGPSPTSTPIGWTFNPRCGGIMNQPLTATVTLSYSFNGAKSGYTYNGSHSANVTFLLDQWGIDQWQGPFLQGVGNAQINDVMGAPDPGYTTDKGQGGPVYLPGFGFPYGPENDMTLKIDLDQCRYSFSTLWTGVIEIDEAIEGGTPRRVTSGIGPLATVWYPLPSDTHSFGGGGSFTATSGCESVEPSPMNCYYPGGLGDYFLLVFGDGNAGAASVSWTFTRAD